MDGSTPRVGVTPRAADDTSVNPEHTETGRQGNRIVTPLDSQPQLPREKRHESDTQPGNLFSRSAERRDPVRTELPLPQLSRMESELDDEEAAAKLAALAESKKRTPAQETNPVSDDTPTPIADNEAPEPARVTLSSLDPDQEKRKEAFKNSLEPKLGFLDKHKKELAVAVAGGVLVGVGIAAAIVFPPAGLCIYAVGVMVLSMGLAKMLFGGLDDSAPAPKPEPEKPKPKPDDEPKPTPKSDDDNDEGKFAAIKKNTEDSLKKSEHKTHQSEKDELSVKSSEEGSSTTSEMTRVSELDIDPASVAGEIVENVEKGLPLSEIVASALAAVFASDATLDPRQDVTFLTDSVLAAADVALNPDLSDRDAAIENALTGFTNRLPSLSDDMLSRFIEMSKKTGDTLTGAGKDLFNTLREKLIEEQSRRLRSGQPALPGLESNLLNNDTDPSISKNLVHYRVFAFELSGSSFADKLSREERNSLLKQAKSVLEESVNSTDPINTMPNARTMTAADFLHKLQAKTGQQYTDILSGISETPHFQQKNNSVDNRT